MCIRDSPPSPPFPPPSPSSPSSPSPLCTGAGERGAIARGYLQDGAAHLPPCTLCALRYGGRYTVFPESLHTRTKVQPDTDTAHTQPLSMSLSSLALHTVCPQVQHIRFLR
eukprot:6236-Rhodomonas_salina.1